MEFNNNQIRRQDRLLSEARAYEILKEGEYGVLSMRTENGEGAYGIPLSYVWDRGNSIYIHCAPVGRKLNCIDACTNVSFCVVDAQKSFPENLPLHTKASYFAVRHITVCTKQNVCLPCHYF